MVTPEKAIIILKSMFLTFIISLSSFIKNTLNEAAIISELLFIMSNPVLYKVSLIITFTLFFLSNLSETEHSLHILFQVVIFTLRDTLKSVTYLFLES